MLVVLIFGQTTLQTQKVNKQILPHHQHNLENPHMLKVTQYRVLIFSFVPIKMYFQNMLLMFPFSTNIIAMSSAARFASSHLFHQNISFKIGITVKQVLQILKKKLLKILITEKPLNFFLQNQNLTFSIKQYQKFFGIYFK